MPTITITPPAPTQSDELEHEFELDVRISLVPAVSEPALNATTITVRSSKCTTCTDICTVTCGGQHCTSICN